MTASIDEMIQNVLRREGGFVNDPDDRGGATKYGVERTLSKFMGRVVSVSEVQNLTIALASEIYERNYYLAPGIHKLPDEIQPFCFDSAVNHGPRRAIKFVQGVANDAGFGPVEEDGIIGPYTIEVATQCQAEMQEVFLAALVEERENFYHLIVDNDPSQAKFLNGWMNRVAEFKTGADGGVA